MSDRFEKAMQGIATRSAANGGPTIADVLTALVAANEDSDERHDIIEKQITEGIGGVNHSLERHCDDNVHMTHAQFAKFMDGRDKRLDVAIATVRQAPRREKDPPTDDHSGDRDTEIAKQTFLMWTIGSKLSYIAIGTIMILVGIVAGEIFGK